MYGSLMFVNLTEGSDQFYNVRFVNTCVLHMYTCSISRVANGGVKRIEVGKSANLPEVAR